MHEDSKIIDFRFWKVSYSLDQWYIHYTIIIKKWERRQRDSVVIWIHEPAQSNEGLITVPPLVVEDYECSPQRGRARGRINSAGWWQDRSRRVNVAREWRLNDRPRGQCGMGHDDRWKFFS